ncbi:MAG: MerR family transcriptional regulator [Calditrichaeota bacterium]|nr:MerR family transcriptional regulator [Calditrichota bacterium]MCB0304881.1 MerR family transcriptional regulator [Calditrichota bacterium]MCB9088852.1 MerR family transcriptional regulator [Calditrichia bacterium]
MSIQKPPKKLYYSLRQTASMTGLSVAVLKNWEKEFPEVQPARNRAGNRHYTDSDLTLLFRIKELLLEKKLSPEEIHTRLRSHPAQPAPEVADVVRLKKVLAEIKLEIEEILLLLRE